MKSYIILIAFIIAAFLSPGCNPKEKFDYQLTVVPDSKSSGITLKDMNSAAEIISKRLNNSFGIIPENIDLLVTENQISLTISNADTSVIALIKKSISGYNRLEFRETYENSEVIGYLLKANDILKASLKTDEAFIGEEFKHQNPLYGIMKPRVTDKGDPLPSCMIGLVNGNDTAEVNRYLKLEQVTAVLPADIRFYWSAKPYKYDLSKLSYGLHAIKIDKGNNQAPLDGSAIISAKPASGSSDSGIKIELTMSDEGAKSWAKITRENTNRCIAVIYNGYVRSYPRVMGEISGGSTEITGDFTIGEANDFANILNAGQLPFGLKIVKEQIIKSE